MKVILTGATGAAGLPMLRALLIDDSITHVTTLTRRPLPSWIALPGGTSATSTDASPTHPKLTAITQTSFLSYSKDLLAEHDACVWALGSTQRGKTEAEYTEFTLGYLKAFLDDLKGSGRVTQSTEGATSPGSVEKPFRFLFVSGEGADSTEKSRTLFARVKGQAENTLLKFAENSNGTFRATIIRPGYFFPSPKYPADAKNQRGAAERWGDVVLGPLVATAASAWYTPVNDMAKFAVEAVKGTWESRGSMFRNAELRKALKEEGISGEK